MDHEKLFKTTKGQSFKCQSKTKLNLAENLIIKLFPMQIQAFDVSNNNFGKGANIADFAHIHSCKCFLYRVIYSVIKTFFFISTHNTQSISTQFGLYIKG